MKKLKVIQKKELDIIIPSLSKLIHSKHDYFYEPDDINEIEDEKWKRLKENLL